ELVVFVPVDVGDEVDPAGPRRQRHRLVDHRGAERATETHRPLQAAGLDDLDPHRPGEGGAGQVGDVVEVVGVDVPGVVVPGAVLVELEQVPDGAAGQDRPVVVEVVDGRQAAV